MSTTVINTRRSAGPIARTALLSVCLGIFAVSCGQRGPLYLPPQDAGANGDTSGSTQADKNPDESEAEVAGEQSADDDEDAHEKTP
jgi:predicted small lipoprotein YifL